MGRFCADLPSCDLSNGQTTRIAGCGCSGSNATGTGVGKWKKANEQVRFRHWLRRVAKNAAINAVTRSPHDAATGGTVVQELIARHADAGETPEQILETEYRRELYRRASRIVQADVESENLGSFLELTIQQHLTAGVK